MNFKKNQKEYLRLFVFSCIALFMTLNAPQAKAIPVVEIGVELVTTILQEVQDVINTLSQVAQEVTDAMRIAWEQMDEYAMPALKSSTISSINSAITSAIGSGNNGKPQFITNWDEYLYEQPKEETLQYMNSFFEETTSGAAGDYENYMINAAKATYEGSDCSVNLEEPAAMFNDETFRSFSQFLEPCNNPYTYPEIAKEEYTNQLKKEQLLAEKEQVDGWLPKIDSKGIISSPATLYQDATQQASQLGNQYILNATSYKDAISAAAMKLGGSTLNFNF
jgi:hypothetical protein